MIKLVYLFEIFLKIVKSKRITDHELKVATNTIGPGEYDFHYNSVKPRCFNHIVMWNKLIIK